MAKFTPDAVLDKMFDYILTEATTLVLCSGQPANYAGIAAVALADVAVADADFTKGNGAVDGRKVDVAAKTDVTIDASGDATHVAIASGTELLYVTTCPTKTLVAGGGNTVDIPGFTITLRDPT
jgi:hypothetical protein